MDATTIRIICGFLALAIFVLLWWKKGRGVARTHKFDPSSYRAIEAALVERYAIAFGEELTVCFSFRPKRKGLGVSTLTRCWSDRPRNGRRLNARSSESGRAACP